MAADHRKDWILREGDRIHCADAAYIITGEPIGYGGSAIVYPARRTDTQLKYAIKECFPKNGSYHRPSGVIVPRDPGDPNSVRLLDTLSRGVRREQLIGQNIHNNGSRAICIRELLRPRAISTGGKTYREVSGSCFAVLDRLDRNTVSFDDLLTQIAASCSPEELRQTEGLPDIHTTACIMEELLTALEQVHSARDADHPDVCGYYFGDLHGGNVYFSGSSIRDGVVGHARLIDFGSAWELDETGRTRQLDEQSVFSALGIRPPEMTRGGVFRLSKASDLFSAGCLMARCVLSRAQLESYPDLLCTGPDALIPEDCGRIRCTPELLALVNRILDRATAFAEARRYQTVPEMLRDIRELKEQSAPLKNQLGLGLSTLAEGAFVGRERERRDLDAALRKCRNPIILHGFPGIGKTEMAIEYGREKSRRARVYFVRFAGSFLQTITGPIADAFSGYSKCSLGGAPKSQARICREVLALLGRCSADDILIIDHCDCASGIFAELRTEEYRLLCTLPMHLMLTTRCDPDGEGQWQQIGPLEVRHLCQLMNRYVPFPPERLEPLIEAVGRHTLMVDLMARTMRESLGALTPESLLQSLTDGSVQNLPRVSTTHDRSSRHTRLQGHLRSLFDLSCMTADEISVLCCATLLPADGMDAALFRQALIEDAPARSPALLGRLRCTDRPVRREQSALIRLTKTGWLTVAGGTLLQIHPVVRELCRADLSPDPGRCGAFLDRLWDWYTHNSFHAARYTQTAHCLAASLTMPGLRDPFRASRAGLLYQKVGRYPEARTYAALALDISRELGAGDADLARFYSNLGAAWGALQDFDRQFDCLQTALSLRQKARPADRLELAASYSDLGSCCGARGQYSLELQYQQQALQIRLELLPPNHPDLADSYSRTGAAMCRSRDPEGGLALQKKALWIREQILPPDHLDLASSHINLASACHTLRRKEESLDHLLTALRIRQSQLPEDHPDLAQAHHNLGVIYDDLGKSHASLEHYLKCLQIRRRTLPGDDPRLMQACSDVAEAYGRLGDHESELTYFLQLLELQENTLPEDHPRMIQPYRSVARVCGELGRPEQRLVYLRKAARSGDTDSMKRLATALIRDGQYQEGRHWLEQAVRMQDVGAAYTLGTLCLNDRIFPRDLKKAIRLMTWAAEQQHIRANQDLGRIYLARHPQVPDYAPLDPRRALKHLYRARELGGTGDDALIREAEELLRF